jgi:hypothetical protein
MAIRWVSLSRFIVIDDDGLTFRTLDPQSGEAGDEWRMQQNCHTPWPLDDGRSLLCSRNVAKLGAVVRVGTLGQRLLRQRVRGGGVGTQLVIGSHFRVVDGEYVVFLTTEGELRAARLDSATFEIGRPVTLVTGIRREAGSVLGQYDISASGTLTYVLGDNAAVGRLMIVRPHSSSPQPMALIDEAAAYTRFTLNSDEHRLAVTVQNREGQELRVYNLVDGRSHIWLKATSIGSAIWSPGGDRLAVNLRNDTTTALVVGSPDAAGAPDTVARGSVAVSAPGVLTWRSDSVLIAIESGRVVALNLKSDPPEADTLASIGSVYFPTLSADRRFLLSGRASGGSAITPFPSQRRRYWIPGANEAVWVSATTVRYRLEPPMDWYEVSVDSVSGEVQGAARLYFSNPGSVSAGGGQSHLVVSNGGMLYVRGPARTSAAYLRVVPNWVRKMKLAVDSAGEKPD